MDPGCSAHCAPEMPHSADQGSTASIQHIGSDPVNGVTIPIAQAGHVVPEEPEQCLSQPPATLDTSPMAATNTVSGEAERDEPSLRAGSLRCVTSWHTSGRAALEVCSMQTDDLFPGRTAPIFSP